jgi:hypothetical protein
VTNLADLLGLRVPLRAILIVLQRAELTEQKEYLGDNDA